MNTFFGRNGSGGDGSAPRLSLSPPGALANPETALSALESGAGAPGGQNDPPVIPITATNVSSSNRDEIPEAPEKMHAAFGLGSLGIARSIHPVAPHAAEVSGVAYAPLSPGGESGRNTSESSLALPGLPENVVVDDGDSERGYIFEGGVGSEENLPRGIDSVREAGRNLLRRWKAKDEERGGSLKTGTLGRVELTADAGLSDMLAWIQQVAADKVGLAKADYCLVSDKSFLAMGLFPPELIQAA